MARVLRFGLGGLVGLAVIWAGSAHAVTYTATPVSATGVLSGVSNVRFEVLADGASPKYGRQLVPVSAASLGKMTVGAMARHPAIHLAVMAYLALNQQWEWDADNHRFKEPDQPAGSTQHGYIAFTCSNCSVWRTTPEQACLDRWAGSYPWQTTGGNTWTNDPPLAVGAQRDYHCTYCHPDHGCHAGQNWARAVHFAPANYPLADEIGAPVPHETVGEQLANAPESLTSQITNNVVNQDITVINNEWPELGDAIVNIENSFTTGDQTSNWTVTEGDTYITNNIEFPVFCGWAPIVCDFINWFQGETPPPEHPPLPTENVESAWDEWDSGLPQTGSCPAPYQTTFQGQAIVIPFDDICWGASNVFRPLLIALSLIAAGFILVGVRGTA